MAMIDIIIEKNIPYHRTGKSMKYQFNKMEVNDSFKIGLTEVEADEALLRNLRSAACQYGRRHNMKFSILKDKEEAGAFRCWRIK